MPTADDNLSGARRYATAEEKWRAIRRRDAAADGQFCYGVRTTGIYCRPHCRSRQPRRENVEFFATVQGAEAAGYRPCKRCRPGTPASPHPAVEDARAYIEAHAAERITLGALSRQVNLSPYHLQRIFKAALGITPHQYHATLRLHSFKARLRNGIDVTTSMHDAGFGSSSRLYEKAAGQLGMKPSVYRRGGTGAAIAFAIIDSDLGKILIAATATGICRLTIGDNPATLERELREEFPSATITVDGRRLKVFTKAVREYLKNGQALAMLPLDLRGTVFQQMVWQALQAIPYGETRSYGEIAAGLGMPQSARAVANACASNPVALVVPCHRVVGKDGGLAGYRWGKQRKKKLLEQEAVRPRSKTRPQ